MSDVGHQSRMTGRPRRELRRPEAVGFQNGRIRSAATATDELVEGTGVDYRAPALPFFMENPLRRAGTLGAQGSFSLANTADRPLPTVATRDVAATAAALLLDISWSGQARVPLVGPDNLTPDAMAEVISGVLGRTVHYRQVPLADYRATLVRHGASRTTAREFAAMIEAQNDGIHDVEPHTPGTAATGFRQWCEDTLKSAARS